MSPKDEKAPVGSGAGGRCCAICCVMGLVPHKVVFDHIAVGVTWAHNALREQRLVRRVGVHLCLEGKAGAPAIVGIVLGVLVAPPHDGGGDIGSGESIAGAHVAGVPADVGHAGVFLGTVAQGLLGDIGLPLSALVFLLGHDAVASGGDIV